MSTSHAISHRTGRVRFRVRHMALGRVAEHEVDAASAKAVPAALAELLNVPVQAADVISTVAVAVPTGAAAGQAARAQGATGSGQAAKAGQRTGSAARGGAGAAFPRRLFCQELAVLLDAGIPLLESLQTLQEKESSPAVAQVLGGLAQSLREGQTLAQAMRAFPQAFGDLLVASVDASSRTGHTATALRQHASYLAWVEGLRGQLVSAMIYPVILVSASLLVIAFLTIFVIPRFAEIYEGMGGDLPWLSGVLLAAGKWAGEHPWHLLAGLLALAFGGLTAWRSPAVRAAAAAQAWALPFVGERLRLVELATLYRTLGLLLQAGVPVVTALEASEPLVSASLRHALGGARERVSHGERLSDSLEREALTTPVSLRMIRVGEHSGELGPMLERAATFYDEEIAHFTQLVGKVISPVLMMVMGVVIGGIVVLMYLPIFQVAEQIQ